MINPAMLGVLPRANPKEGEYCKGMHAIFKQVIKPP